MPSEKARLQHKTEIQAVLIEQIFARHDFPATVSRGRVSARSTTFLLDVPLNAIEPDLAEVECRVRAVLNAARVHLDWVHGRLEVQVADGPAAPVNLVSLSEQLPDLPFGVIALGQAEDGRPVYLNMFAPGAAHVLIVGRTGAGKSSLLRSIALSLGMAHRQSEMQMAFVDRAGKGLHAMHYLPHALGRVAQGAGEIDDLFRFLQQEVDYRTRRGIRWPAIMTFVDGLSELLEDGDAGVEDLIASLLRRGVRAGLYLILTARDIPSREMAHALRAHAPDRIVGRVADSEAALAAGGRAGTDAQFLFGRGDFLAINDDSSIRFQAAYADEYDLHLCLETLHRRRRPPLLARPFDVRQQLAPAGYVNDQHFQFTFDGEQLVLGR